METYPEHNSYIDTTYQGVDQANVKFIYGTFAGIKNVGDLAAMSFSRMVVVSTVLDRTELALDVKVDLRTIRPNDYYEGAGENGKFIHAEIARTSHLIGSNLLYHQSSDCRDYVIPHLDEFEVFTFIFDIFVYLHTLSLRLDVYIDLVLDADATMCPGKLSDSSTVTETFGILNPRVHIFFEGSISEESYVRHTYVHKA